MRCIRPQSRVAPPQVTKSTGAMNVSEVFIRRPIATSLLMLGIADMGITAYKALPVSDLPNVDVPMLRVAASLPGGDPATLPSAVTSPLERQFTTIADINEMTSSRWDRLLPGAGRADAPDCNYCRSGTIAGGHHDPQPCGPGAAVATVVALAE